MVGDDASYVKPFTTNAPMIGPVQTTDVLIKADPRDMTLNPFDNTTSSALMGEQSIIWNILRVAKSQHQGAKHRQKYYLKAHYFVSFSI